MVNSSYNPAPSADMDSNMEFRWLTATRSQAAGVAVFGAFLVLSVAATAMLWGRGLGNLVYEQGRLEIEVDATGADILPLYLDSEGREVVDIALDRYLHHGQFYLAPRRDPRRAAFVAIIDETGSWCSPRSLGLKGQSDPGPLDGCGYPGIWMGDDALRAVAFRQTYEEASAVLFLPDGPVAVRLTVDGRTRQVIVEPDEDKLAYLPLRPVERSAAARVYQVTIPAVEVSHLRLAPLAGSTCRVIRARLILPGVIDLQPPSLAAIEPADVAMSGNSTIDLTGPIHYGWPTLVRRVGLFLASTGVLLGIACCLWRLRGSIESTGLARPPLMWWEPAMLVACLGLNLWLQQAVCGWYCGDSQEYVSQAISLLDSGGLDDRIDGHPPGFSLFIGLIFALGGSGGGVWLANSLLLLIAVLAAWHLGRTLGGRVGGGLAAVCVASNPILLIAHRVLLPDFLAFVLGIGWFYVVMRWCLSSPRSSWRWALVAALGWLVLAAVRSNAVSLLGVGLVVPFLQRGSLRWRAVAMASFLAVAVGCYSGLQIGSSSKKMLAAGRLWPILHHRLLALHSGEFRPIRREYLLSKAQAGEWKYRTFYDMIYTDERAEESDAAITQTVNASLRRHSRDVLDAFLGCLGYAYVQYSRAQLHGMSRAYETEATYDRLYSGRLDLFRGDLYSFHPDTKDYLATFRTPHREGTMAIAAFQWLLEDVGPYRLWPMTCLALIGLVYAVGRRQGLLLLPAILNLGVVLPLCLLLAWYDRYFLPGEAFLALQAAVGARALYEWGVSAVAAVWRLRDRPPMAAVTYGGVEGSA